MTVHQIKQLGEVKARSLADTGFSDDDATEIKNRLIVAIDGESGSGKNRLAFSAPDPIAFMSFDPNYEKAYREAKASGVRIHRVGYSVPIIKPDGRDGEKIAKALGEVWDEFSNDFMGAVRDSSIETIVIDTATELFELVTYAIYGKNVQVMPKERGHAYAAYRQVIREVENTSKNLVLLHKLKDEWRNDKSTGNRIRAGYKDTAFCCNTELLLEKNPTEQFPDRYHCFIKKATFNPAIEWDGNGNGELIGDLISWETISTMVFE